MSNYIDALKGLRIFRNVPPMIPLAHIPEEGWSEHPEKRQGNEGHLRIVTTVPILACFQSE